MISAWPYILFNFFSLDRLTFIEKKVNTFIFKENFLSLPCPDWKIDIAGHK